MFHMTLQLDYANAGIMLHMAIQERILRALHLGDGDSAQIARRTAAANQERQTMTAYLRGETSLGTCMKRLTVTYPQIRLNLRVLSSKKPKRT